MNEQNFNWVEARAKCAPSVVFEEIAGLLSRDVEAANAHKIPTLRFECLRLSPTVVNVVRHQDYGGFEQANRNVSFELLTDGIQAVEHEGTGKVVNQFTGLPALNGEGLCVIRLGSRELALWQFCREALESLFFPHQR